MTENDLRITDDDGNLAVVTISDVVMYGDSDLGERATRAVMDEFSGDDDASIEVNNPRR